MTEEDTSLWAASQAMTKRQPLLDVDDGRAVDAENDGFGVIEDDLKSRPRTGSVISSAMTRDEDAKPLTKVLQNKCAISEASICSRLFFSWAMPILSAAQKEQLHIEQLGKLQDSDEIHYNL